jgi:hypothetical protein
MVCLVSGNEEEALLRRAVAAFNEGDIEGYLSGFAPTACARWAD